MGPGRAAVLGRATVEFISLEWGGGALRNGLLLEEMPKCALKGLASPHLICLRLT